MRILVIIPAYNEAENIERVVETLRNPSMSWDYVVINDGSRDKTAEICAAKHYRFLDLPVNLGLTGAFQTGIRLADKLGYDAALQFDGDGQHDAAYIPEMVKAMREGACDIVIGSRFRDSKKPVSLRMLGSWLITFAIRLTTGRQIRDPTSGMRLYNRKIVEKMARNINLGPEPDTISYLMLCGAEVREVPVTMRERIAGESYLNMARSLRYMLNMFVSILFVQFFRRKDGI